MSTNVKVPSRAALKKASRRPTKQNGKARTMQHIHVNNDSSVTTYTQHVVSTQSTEAQDVEIEKPSILLEPAAPDKAGSPPDEGRQKQVRLATRLYDLLLQAPVGY